MEDQTPKVIRTYHHNGLIRDEYFRMNGKTEGLYKQYSYICNGENNYKSYLSKTMNFVNDKPHGECINYRASGEIEEIAYYNNGKKHGYTKKFYKNGIVVAIIEYDNGEMLNMKQYDNNSNLKVEYLDSKMTKYRKYDMYGNLIEEIL